MKKKKPDIVKNGLVCWLDGRDGINGNPTWRDRSGNGNDATLYNFNWTSESGFDGKSLKFDGVDDYLNINNISLNGTTLECFVKGTSPSFAMQKGIDQGVSQNGYGIALNNNLIYCWQKIDEQSPLVPPAEDRPSFEIGDNLHIVLSFDKTTKKQILYLNSKIIYQIELKEFNLELNTYKYLFGSLGNQIHFKKGMLFSTKIYNRALTSEEIQQNYNYEQSIDRTVPTVYPLVEETKDYCIGNTTDLTEKQKKSFRISVNKSKFVTGVNNVQGIAVETYTYSEIQKLMETPEWKDESDKM